MLCGPRRHQSSPLLSARLCVCVSAINTCVWEAQIIRSGWDMLDDVSFPGGECQAAWQSVPQEKQSGHPVPDSHSHHLCGEWVWGAQWNLGEQNHRAQFGKNYGKFLWCVEMTFNTAKITTYKGSPIQCSVFSKKTSNNKLCNFCFSYQVFHSLVSSVEKQGATDSGCPLLVHCKNFQVLNFVIPREQECHDVFLSLQRLSQPGKTCFSASALLLNPWSHSHVDVKLMLNAFIEIVF